jgi:predicted RNA methylase
MPKYQTKITDQDAAILRQCIFTHDSLTLPAQLPRPDYIRIAKVIEAAGGKWNRGREAHVFASGDPQTIFATALDKGGIVDERKARQAFFTPPDVADRLVRLSDITGGMMVLEPSAGEGAIAEAIARIAVRQNIRTVEIDESSATTLNSKGFNVALFDFLKMDPDYFQFSFDAAVMNPPFTKGQDIAHVTHALSFIRPGGSVTAITATGWQFHQNAKAQAFRDLVANCGEVLEELPSGTFTASGTDVATLIVQLRNYV